MGAPPGNRADREEGERRGGYQPEADASPITNDVGMMTEKGEISEYIRSTPGEGTGRGSRKGGGEVE